MCDRCFIEDVRERVKAEALRLGLHTAKKIVLAVSGGKDSLVLADTLSSVVDTGRLIGFNIVEGIEGYNRESQARKLEKHLRDLGIQLVRTSFKEEVGHSLDEMVRASQRAGLRTSACTFCGGFRRKLINNAGREVGADYVATGHNLDDEVQTIIINLLRGDVKKLVRVGDSPLRLSDKFVMRVKPLRRVYEWETAMYAYLKGFKFQDTECPYISSRPTMRSKVRELMYAIEEERPGALLKILDTYDRIAEEVRRSSNLSPLPSCRICGEPTSFGRDVCKNCELLISSGLLKGDH